MDIRYHFFLALHVFILVIVSCHIQYNVLAMLSSLLVLPGTVTPTQIIDHDSAL